MDLPFVDDGKGVSNHQGIPDVLLLFPGSTLGIQAIFLQIRDLGDYVTSNH